MEADFVNEYIGRLNAKLHDTTSQLVMAETRAALADKLVAALQTELEKTRLDLEKLQKKNTKPE